MIEGLRKLLSIQRELYPRPFQHPVFLVGCMRSGTTFLANLLAEHPQLLHLEGELNNVWHDIGGLGGEPINGYADRERLSNSSVANMAAYFERCQHEFSGKKYHWWRRLNNWKKGTGGVYKDWNHLILLNKSVHLVNRTDYLLNMFTESKVILLIRSIEAQVNSIKLHFEKEEALGRYAIHINESDAGWRFTSNPHEKNWDIEKLAHKWIDLNKQAITDLHRNEQDRYFILQYEDLVKNPQQKVATVYKFLNISPRMLKVTNTLTDRKSFNTHTGGNPLNDWHKRLSINDLQIIDGVKKQRLDDYEYIQSKLHDYSQE